MTILTKITPTVFVLLLLSGYAAAMVVEGNAILGLPPNSVVELDLGLGATATAKTNAQGEVQLVEEDDDDVGTLYIPTGSEGFMQLRDARSGRVLGGLVIEGQRLSVASDKAVKESQWEGARSGKRWGARGTLDAGLSLLLLDDIKENTANGQEEAVDQGFNASGSSDDDAWGWSLGVGVALGDLDAWDSKGSSQWHARLGYSSWEEMEGQFTARAPGLTVQSSGEQEVESWELSLGYEYFVADRFGISASLGYAWFDIEDSGQIVRQEDGFVLSTFSDSRDDGTAIAGIGLSYRVTDSIGAGIGYQQTFDDVGSSESDKARIFRMFLRHSF